MSRIVLTSPYSCVAERLAGVAAVQHVDGAVLQQGVGVSHVGEDGHMGPVAVEDGATVGVGFAEEDGSDAQGSGKSEIQTADSAKERTTTKGLSVLRIQRSRLTPNAIHHTPTPTKPQPEPDTTRHTHNNKAGYAASSAGVTRPPPGLIRREQPLDR